MLVLSRTTVYLLLLTTSVAAVCLAQQSPRIPLTNQGMLNECDPPLPCEHFSVEFDIVEGFAVPIAMSLNGVTEVSEVHFGIEIPPQPIMHLRCSGELGFTYSLDSTILGVEWAPDGECQTLSGSSVRIGTIFPSVESPRQTRLWIIRSVAMRRS